MVCLGFHVESFWFEKFVPSGTTLKQLLSWQKPLGI